MSQVELRGITKRFGPVTALNQVDFTLNDGEIHALLGENGAGKTTLMKVLYGMHQPDEGEIRIDGQAKTFKNSTDAIAQGIGMVHQHFMLVPVLTVAENIVAGKEPRRGIRFDMEARGARGAGAVGAVRLLGGPARQSGAAVGRRAPARGDPQDPVQRRKHADFRRAHGRADAHRGQGAVRGDAPAQSGRQKHHHHHAQACTR